MTRKLQEYQMGRDGALRTNAYARLVRAISRNEHTRTGGVGGKGELEVDEVERAGFARLRKLCPFRYGGGTVYGKGE